MVWFAAARWKPSSGPRWVTAARASTGGRAEPAAGPSTGGSPNSATENAEVDESPADEPEVGKAAPTLVGASAGGTPPAAAGSPGARKPGTRSSTYGGGWAGQPSGG